MNKIMIFTDSVYDAADRYYALTKRYDVHIRYTPEILAEDVRMLGEAGFNKKNIYKYDQSEDMGGFELYILDEIRERNLIMIKDFPRERCYINKGSPTLKEKAIDEGYNSLEGNIKDMIKGNDNERI